MSAYIYLLSNKLNTVLYTGVTSNLVKRIHQHKIKAVQGFTSKYNVGKLVYFEVFDNINEALQREKQIKAGSRKKKIELILKTNPKFSDLYDGIV